MGSGVGMTWGVTVGIASAIALARWSMSRFSSSSEGPQAGSAKARAARNKEASPIRVNACRTLLLGD